MHQPPLQPVQPTAPAKRVRKPLLIVDPSTNQAVDVEDKSTPHAAVVQSSTAAGSVSGGSGYGSGSDRSTPVPAPEPAPQVSLTPRSQMFNK